MRRDPAGEEELEDAQPQDVRERAARARCDGPLGELLERRVQRAAALHGAERQMHREGAVARIEPARSASPVNARSA